MTIKARISSALKSIDALTLRERLFVFAAMLIVISGAWQAFLAGPLEAREQIASAKVESMRERLEQLNESITLAAQGMSDGMPADLERLRVLRARVAEGEESMRIFTTDLVDPAQMRFVLEDLIRRQAGLRLISAANLEVRPVIESAGDEDNSEIEVQDAGAGGPVLYRHGLVLVLEGRYLDCLSYLESVERLPWQLYWARLQLHNEDYPRTRIVLELHTLSLEEEWIGV